MSVSFIGRDARNVLHSAARRAVDGVLSIVLAPSCAACGEPLDRPMDGPVCARCWRAVLPLTPPLCEVCGDPLPAWRVVSIPLARCPRCRRGARHVSHARAIGEYAGALKAIIHAWKYEGRRSLAAPLAGLMRQRGADLISRAACAVPVPLHLSRRCARGFNQATDLASRLGLPVCHPLRRVRATPSQTGLPAVQRRRNMRGAFATRRSIRDLAGSTVVLVDDVSTTGATLEACARVLREAGVGDVLALTAARVVAPRR